MKKLYFTSNTHEPGANIKNIIKHHFFNFSLKEFEKITWDELREFYESYLSHEEALNSFKEGKWYSKRRVAGENAWDFTSMIITEFSFSEDDLFNCLLHERVAFKNLNIKPTNAWYYINQNGKVKEITLKGFI